jgi:sulfonate transport system substrate-binding protein
MRNVAITLAGRASGGSRTGRRVGAGTVVAGLLLFGGATACSSSGSGSAASTPAASGTASANQVSVSDVTLNVGDQAGSGEQALLTAAGLINKLPFKVHFADFTSGPPILQAMAAGSVDIGGVGDAPPVFSAASNSPIAVVSALQTNVDDVGIVVPDGSPIKTVAQLKGKKVAVAEGTAGDYELLAALTHAGLTIKDVTAENLQPADAQAAFAAGHVDAWAIWAPFLEQAELQDHARVVANQSGLAETYSFVVASRAALANPAKAEAIKDYLQLLDQAYTWAASHQSVWAATWAKATGLSLPIMTQAVKDSTDVPTPINSTVLSSEQAVANAFSTAGLIPSQVTFSNFAVTTFNNVTGSSS